MKKLLFILTVISISASQAFAQCQANFTWSQTSNNVISFTNTSTGTTPNTIYTWDFGDASYSWTISPTHTYNIPGTYYVCLTLQDSLQGNSTFCDTIIVTGTIICNITLTTSVTLASCSTCPDGTAHAVAANGTPPYSYLWQTVPPQTAPTASGLAPGTYTCCVTDANACTACNTATVSTSICQANFTWSQTTNNVILFTNTSTGTTFYTNYLWSFGDNTSNSAQNPSHYYNLPGTYIVCLQINDSFACSSTFCDTITVTGVNCNNLAVTVAATDASCPLCNDGSATANPTGGTPPYSYLWSNANFTQTINNLVSGYYIVTVTDSIGCMVTGTASIDSMGGCSSNFTLNYVSPQVYNAVNLATGAPPLTYLWSWGDNTTSNTAFPTHTYPSSGVYTICLAITDALGCSSTYCDSFYLVRLAIPFSVITVTVVPPNPNGIYNAPAQNYCSVFPNPASDYLVIDYSLAASANTQIILSDMLGNTLRSFRDDLSEGKHAMLFDIADLKQGFYLLSLKSEYYSVTKPVSIVK